MSPRPSSRRSPKPKSEFQERVVQLDRVTRTVKGGRRMRFRASVVIGNMKGKVGFGVGKGNEVQLAIQKAVADAKRSLINVPIKEETIAHPVNARYKGARILLMPAAPGTGIIAGGAVRTIIDVSGIKNILSKSHGSSNKLTTSRATIQALSSFADGVDTSTKA